MPGSLNRVLYVEDDPIIAELALMALEEMGELTVRHCASGHEALETVDEFRPDLILLDVMMPGMDGLETLRRLRDTAAGAAPPAVFMSAKVQKQEQALYLEAGACGVVSKPFDPVALPDTLREFWAGAIAA